MKDQLNEIIEKINFSIRSINVQNSLFQFGTPIVDVPYLMCSPPPYEIPALRDVLNTTASICRAYEQELWKDRPDYKFIRNMESDIIQRKDFITGIINDIK